jgi:hypothetical protein
MEYQDIECTPEQSETDCSICLHEDRIDQLKKSNIKNSLNKHCILCNKLIIKHRSESSEDSTFVHYICGDIEMFYLRNSNSSDHLTPRYNFHQNIDYQLLSSRSDSDGPRMIEVD